MAKTCKNCQYGTSPDTQVISVMDVEMTLTQDGVDLPITQQVNILTLIKRQMNITKSIGDLTWSPMRVTKWNNLYSNRNVL